MELTKSPALPPELRRYASYREYIRDFYAYKKSQRSGFSYRLFAKRAGMKSPNYLQLVILGKRNLSLEGAARVAKAMVLKSSEAEYFQALAGRDLATSHEERLGAERQLLVAMKKLVSKAIPNVQVAVLSTWYHLVVRELVFLPDFEADGEWISQKLRGLISPEQAEESLKLLVDGGFLELRKGKYVACDPVIDTGDSLGSARILKTHIETLGAWRKILLDLREDERELGLINIPIAAAKIPEFKQRMRAFQDEIIGWLQDESAPDQVVQLGMYLIPVALPTRGLA